MRIALLNDTEKHGNWGSQACAATLKRILLEEFPGAELASLPSDLTTARFRKAASWLGGGIYGGSRRLFDRYSEPFYGDPAFADDFEAALEEWRDGRGGPFADAALSALRGADVAVFNGEGSTYRMNVSAVRCLFALWVATRELGIPSVFLNGSVMLGGVDPVLPAIVRKVFRSIGAVALREPASLRDVKAVVPEARARVVPDSTFLLAEDAPSPSGNAGLRAGWNGRDYFCVSSSMLHSVVPAPLRFGIARSSLFRLVEKLRSIVPNVTVLARDKEDVGLMKALAASVEAHFVGPMHSYGEVLDVLRGARFLLSGRYHHLIFATVVGCPSIPLRTTSHKVDGLCELLNGSIGVPEDPTDLLERLPQIAARAQEIVDEGAALREQLAAQARSLAVEARGQGTITRAALEAAPVP